MTVMTDRDKIRQFTVLPITINMMNYQNAFINISAIVTFFFVNLPSIDAITSGHLPGNRFSIPIYDPASSRTENTPLFVDCNIFRNTKFIFTFFAKSDFFTTPTSQSTSNRTESLGRFWMFFRDKFFLAKIANIINNRFCAKNAPTFSSTGIISVLMAFWDTKYRTANRTFFFNLFHEAIIA